MISLPLKLDIQNPLRVVLPGEFIPSYAPEFCQQPDIIGGYFKLFA